MGKMASCIILCVHMAWLIVENVHVALSLMSTQLTGFASMAVPVYLSEVSPVELRGRITVVNNIFITGGQVISAIVSGIFSEVPMGWR